MKKITSPTKEELETLYVKLGYTVQHLADYYKCSTGPIKKWLRAYNIKKSMDQRLEARKETCLRKYGAPSPFESKSFQSKVQSLLKQTIYDNPERVKEIQNKRENTMEFRFGVKNPGQLKSTKEKVKITTQRLYGKDYYTQTEEYKQRAMHTNIIKRGVPFAMQSEDVKSKSKETCLHKYGVDNYAKSSESKSKYKNKEYVKQIVHKQYVTRKQNHTFNVSKSEEDCYNLLLTKYSKDDVIRQYKSSLYPFNCDLYIKSLDLYIELNFFWMHGGEPFNSDNPQHIEKLEVWKSKNNKSFDNAIDTWTVRDVLKLETFKRNNLNYKIFYTIMDFLHWFKGE